MASLVIESHKLVQDAEDEIFKEHQNEKFLINSNSCVTNIDIISEIFNSDKIKEKAKLRPSRLSSIESIENIL
jgi:predicted metal-dependent TIM-barrel fold hydrolase